MDDEAPTKRVTRSRAAAKATEPPKVKIATAASRVKATRAATSTTVAASMKRKTRAEDAHYEDEASDNEEAEEPMEREKSEPARTARGRAKKLAHEDQERTVQESSTSAPSTRGRPKKKVADAPPSAPVRTTRGRPKKVENPAEEPVVTGAASTAESEPEPVKKAARFGRTAISKPPAVAKKNVTFEEKHDVDKENHLPTRALRGKAKVVEEPTGLRAKPLRRPAAAAPRNTRGRPKTVAETEKTEEPVAPGNKSSPLSPKKITQIATAKEPSSDDDDDDDDDELSTMHKTPMQLLTRSPVKPISVMDPARKLDFTTSITMNRLTTDTNAPLLRSPARKVPQSAFLDMNSPSRQAPQAEYKDSLKESPKKFNLSDSMAHAPFKASHPVNLLPKSPFKAPLLQSPARRPPSPEKPAESSTTASFGTTPNVSKFKISRFTTPKTTSKSVFRTAAGESIVRPNTTAAGSRFKTTGVSGFPAAAFHGRLSAIVPRDIDPDVSPAKVPTEIKTEDAPVGRPESIQEELAAIEDPFEDVPVETITEEEDPMLALENQDFRDEIAWFQNSTRSTMPPASPPTVNSNPLFELRPENRDQFQDSDSEDELASSHVRYSPAFLSPQKMASPDLAMMPQTPNPVSGHMIERHAPGSIADQGTIRARRSKIGFTPLARQLSEWMATSPERKDEDPDCSTVGSLSPEEDVKDELLPNKSSFFDDEMLVKEKADLIEDAMDIDGEVVMNEMEFDDEDMELAAEADEMSLVGPPVEVEAAETDGLLDANNVEERPSEKYDATPARSVSDCSQQYGDENEVPIDPALLSQDAQLPCTPVAVQPRTFIHSYTVSKVPLKPAAEDSPIKYTPMKRSASVSRLPPQRGDGRSSSAPAFSLSPSKHVMKSRQDQPLEEILDEITTPRPSKVAAPVVQSSSAVKPAPTTGRELDPQLLKGAIVYVDVHTTEGADASGIFVELLTRMGAKCIKTWTWNPNSSSSPDSDGLSTANKIGITHVVFKDGGKRTLEKVRESNGIVLCVGVGWVLDCERENAWLDESLYAVDTSIIPRGGHKRRKSMEPRALANLNGTLVPFSTPGRPSTSANKQFLDTPKPSNRRASREWIRTPKHSSPEERAALEALEQDLLPVPATPAPVSAYSESALEDDDEDELATPYFLHPKDLVQMTCPPKKMQRDYESESNEDTDGVAGNKGDGGVMARLLMARRKSLQFAPKVGSPLGRFP